VIDRARLTQDLQALIKRLEDDLRERVAGAPELRAHLETEWRKGKDAHRTSESFEEWAEPAYTQSAVAWVLACVFVRYLEDNAYLDRPYLSGPGSRAEIARDHRMEAIRRDPRSNERDYLLAVFEEVGRLPAMAGLLSDRKIPLWSLPLSADGARALYEFWQKRDASGAIVHDFTDAAGDTRFLGDLYQDLSEAARKRYALLQTPIFVEEFLLDRTLDPAIEEFGLAQVTLIDPTCGSGHFLLGAFARLFDRRAKAEPARSRTDLAQGALRQVAGVDLNPYAIAITRFRLLLAALRAAGVTRLARAPGFELNLAAGDSLLHGHRRGVAMERQGALLEDPLATVYETEDASVLYSILGKTYHVVVGNPPYITVGDAALNEAYRARYGSCYRQYSVAVPFTERFFDLAMAPVKSADRSPAGFVGMITANSFMKREFGKRLIEDYIPRWDLTHIIDTSGAYIPGHGTPTVILIGRQRRPQAETIRAVLGIRGEPSTPEEPARGLVWSAICSQLDHSGSESEFVSVADVPRERFAKHPWAMGGGGAADLKFRLDATRERTLADCIDEVGFGAVTREDDAYMIGAGACRRAAVAAQNVRPMVEGEAIRDWVTRDPTDALWPYDENRLTPLASTSVTRQLWPLRTNLSQRVAFGSTQIERKLEWFEYSMFFRERYRNPLGIAFASIATHNHFVLDRGGKVFKQSAPVIKLKPGATEDDHYALLGLLNSSVACFWMKQVFYPKAGSGMGRGIQPEAWMDRFDFDCTKIKPFPLPSGGRRGHAHRMSELAAEDGGLLEAVVAKAGGPRESDLRAAESGHSRLRAELIALQEELDWECYRLYGLMTEDLTCDPKDVPGLSVGERAFEIHMARRVAAGELQTAWFERHAAIPRTELPASWPSPYRRIVERRLEAIDSIHEIGLIERPEYKRRWSEDPWKDREQRAVEAWLLDRLESPHFWSDGQPASTARLADRARHDTEFLAVAALYRGSGAALDVDDLIQELVLGEAVPFLAALRYTPSGLLKRHVWERTWDLQRAEDAIDARTRLPAADPQRLSEDEAKSRKAREIGEIPVPPRYDTKDFRGSSAWRLRGKLDVPKERFILYPGAERDSDPTPLVGWAGWDHLQQAQALASYIVERSEKDGWGVDRL